MNGAECLLRTLLANDVNVCFMNPGTSEMQFVSALDRAAEMRGVLCLYEGVCSGAADGYARMSGKPAATLLHLGPGLANALSNLHNARKAHSPVINIVGEHTTGHQRYNAPLSADTAAFARTVSGWVRVLETAEGTGAAASKAIAASLAPPGQVATLIVPADFSWSESGMPGARVAPQPAPVPAGETVRTAGCLLRSGRAAGLLLGGHALYGPALDAAGRIAAATGARVFADRFSPRIEQGRSRFAPRRLAYFPEAAEAMLAGLKHLILVEAEPPVSFFGYPDRRSSLAPEHCEFHVLAAVGENGTAALDALAEECGSARLVPPVPQASTPPLPAGAPLTAATIGMVIGALLPEGAILSDEMITAGEQVGVHLAGAAPHDLLPVTGGSIGQGLPVAAGAAVACPGRKVIALEADGSGMYTLQSLWTMARERLDVVTVIFANRRYRILEVELRRTGAAAAGPLASAMMDIGRPNLDWVKLSEGMGVEAVRATSAGGFISAFRTAISQKGPRLIEAVLAPDGN